jgi:hypothetical protein
MTSYLELSRRVVTMLGMMSGEGWQREDGDSSFSSSLSVWLSVTSALALASASAGDTIMKEQNNTKNTTTRKFTNVTTMNVTMMGKKQEETHCVGAGAGACHFQFAVLWL